MSFDIRMCVSLKTEKSLSVQIVGWDCYIVLVCGNVLISPFIQINGRPVFNMTHGDCVREIKNSGQSLRLECER